MRNENNNVDGFMIEQIETMKLSDERQVKLNSSVDKMYKKLLVGMVTTALIAITANCATSAYVCMEKYNNSVEAGQLIDELKANPYYQEYVMAKEAELIEAYRADVISKDEYSDYVEEVKSIDTLCQMVPRYKNKDTKSVIKAITKENNKLDNIETAVNLASVVPFLATAIGGVCFCEEKRKRMEAEMLQEQLIEEFAEPDVEK